MKLYASEGSLACVGGGPVSDESSVRSRDLCLCFLFRWWGLGSRDGGSILYCSGSCMHGVVTGICVCVCVCVGGGGGGGGGVCICVWVHSSGETRSVPESEDITVSGTQWLTAPGSNLNPRRACPVSGWNSFPPMGRWSIKCRSLREGRLEGGGGEGGEGRGEGGGLINKVGEEEQTLTYMVSDSTESNSPA